MNYQQVRELQVYILHCQTHSMKQCHECKTCTAFAQRKWTISCPFCNFHQNNLETFIEHTRNHARLPRPQLIRHLMRASNRYIHLRPSKEDSQNKRLIEYLSNPRDLFTNFRMFLIDCKITRCNFCLAEVPGQMISHLDKHLRVRSTSNLPTSSKNIAEVLESFQTHCSLSHADEMFTVAENYLTSLRTEAKRQNGHALFFTMSELASDNDKLTTFCKDPPYGKCSCCRFFKAKIFFLYFLSDLLRVMGNACLFECVLDDCGESFSSLNMLIRHCIFIQSDKDREKFKRIRILTQKGMDQLPICVLYAKHSRGHTTNNPESKLSCVHCKRLLAALDRSIYSVSCPVCLGSNISNEALLEHFAKVHGPSIPRNESLSEAEFGYLHTSPIIHAQNTAKEEVKSKEEEIKPKQSAPEPRPEPTIVSLLKEITTFDIMTDIAKHSRDHQPAFFYPNCPRCSGHFSRFLNLSRKSRVVDNCVVCPACHALFRLFLDLYKHWMEEHFMVHPNKNAKIVNDPPKKDDSFVPNVDPALENAIEMIVGHELVDSATFFLVD